MTALHHLARRCKDTVALDFFTSNGDDLLNIKDSEGNSPCLIAVSNNEIAVINYLFKKSGIKQMVNELGENALHLAAKRNDLSVLKEVLELRLDLNSKRSDGLTALHIAAMKANDDLLLKLLIKAGADKHILTEFKESAFDLASENEVLQSKNIPLIFLK
jgi:ankyrin repeat protein